MSEYTLADLYAGLNAFKTYVQANMPYKWTFYTGTANPSTAGFVANVPSVYVQVSDLTPTQTVVATWVKSGPTDTAWSSLTGTIWLSGSAVPLVGDGANGNFYLRTGTNEIYLKNGGTWSIVLDAGLDMTIVPIVGDTHLVTASNNGKTLVFNTNNPITLTVPQQTTETLTAGINVQFRNKGTGQVTLALQGADLLEGAGSVTNDAHKLNGVYLETAGSPNTWVSVGDFV